MTKPKRVRRHSNVDYAALEYRMRGLWHACARAGASEAAIEREALCSKADAYRLATFRRASTPALARLWLDGALTFRQAYRIAVLDEPDVDEGAEARQLELARRYEAAKAILDAPDDPLSKRAP